MLFTPKNIFSRRPGRQEGVPKTVAGVGSKVPSFFVARGGCFVRIGASMFFSSTGGVLFWRYLHRRRVAILQVLDTYDLVGFVSNRFVQVRGEVCSIVAVAVSSFGLVADMLSIFSLDGCWGKHK